MCNEEKGAFVIENIQKSVKWCGCNIQASRTKSAGYLISDGIWDGCRNFFLNLFICIFENFRSEYCI